MIDLGKRNCSIIFSFILVFIIFLEVQAEQTKLNAHQIIEKMGETYKKCLSYQDSGVIQKTPIDPSNKQVVQKPFKTYFAQPNLFCFEWKEKIPQKEETLLYVVWHNGKEAYTYWELGKFEKENSLEQAIVANSGISSSGISTVPLMLINQERSFILKSLIDEILVREDVIDGVKCYVIQAKYEKLGREVELWIGKDDFLLRKLKRKLSSGAISEEIHKNIELDHKISKEIFNFKPPLRKKNRN